MTNIEVTAQEGGRVLCAKEGCTVFNLPESAQPGDKFVFVFVSGDLCRIVCNNPSQKIITPNFYSIRQSFYASDAVKATKCHDTIELVYSAEGFSEGPVDDFGEEMPHFSGGMFIAINLIGIWELEKEKRYYNHGPKITMLSDGRMDTKNAALYLGLKVTTLTQMRYKKRGPAYTKRGRVYYYKADLDKWLEEGRVNHD